MRRVSCALAAMAAAATISLPAWGHAFPERPITLIVPFSPGASADGLARLTANELSRRLGQPVVVENRPGAGGATGLMALAKAAPDGYTLGMGATGAIAVNPHVPGSAPLDPKRELAPVAKLADIPLVLVADAKTGLKTVNDVVAAYQKQPDKLSYGSTGNNTAQHLSAELFNKMAGTKIVHVPYKGSAPAVTDTLSGTLQLSMVDLTSAAPHLKAGTLVAIGTTSPQRVSAAPDIPTIAEGGLDGYAATAWMGIFAPHGIDPTLAKRISAEIGDILAQPEIQEKVLGLGAEAAYLNPDEFSAFIDAASQQWGELVKAANPS
ncbi:MAG: tripartite tricarboxylate transporter substrate binding protein [Pigmentiphaga sp.]|nr:tripartite tricarboxylate transporter substrate binding protein [Pigmentiphaga sp.]